MKGLVFWLAAPPVAKKIREFRANQKTNNWPRLAVARDGAAEKQI